MTCQPLKYLFIIKRILHGCRCLSVEEFGFFCIRLECALRLNTSTVYEFLPLLPSLRILIKTIKLIKFWKVILFFLSHDQLRLFWNLGYESQSFRLFPILLHSLNIKLLFDCLSILKKEVFRFFVILSHQTSRHRVDLWSKSELLHFSSVEFRSGSVSSYFKLFFSSHTSLIKLMAVITPTAVWISLGVGSVTVIFVSCVEIAGILDSLPGQPKLATFHVERGTITAWFLAKLSYVKGKAAE